MPGYDDRLFAPAAPVALVTLVNPETSATFSDVTMLIDTGADVTLIPAKAVERLGVSPIENLTYDLIGFDGRISSAQAAVLHLILLGKSFKGRFLLIQ